MTVLRHPMMVSVVVLLMSTMGAGQVSAQESPSPAPNCAQGTGPPIAAASHPNDGLPDPAGRIVFGRLTRVDDIRDQLVSLYAIDPDGSDLVQLLDCEVGRPRFSPDGSRLAFGIAMDDGTMQIATMAADGSDLRDPHIDRGVRRHARLVARRFLARLLAQPGPVRGFIVGALRDRGRHAPDALAHGRRRVRSAAHRRPRHVRLGAAALTRWARGRVHAHRPSRPSRGIWFTPMIRDLETGAERVVTANELEPEHPEWSRDGRSDHLQHAPRRR